MSKQAEEFLKNEYPNLYNGTIKGMYKPEWIFRIMQDYHESRVNAVTDEMQDEVDKVQGQDEWSNQFKKGYLFCHSDYKITIKNKLLNK